MYRFPVASAARMFAVSVAAIPVGAATIIPPASAVTAESAYAVVAIWVVLVSAVAVGATGTPVSVGLAFGASSPSAVSARVVSVATALVANVSAVDCAVVADPAASNAVLAWVAAVPRPRFVLAVAAFARSERLFAF